MAFISQLWRQYPDAAFLKEEPKLLARHPIQHGRKEPPNEKIEGSEKPAAVASRAQIRAVLGRYSSTTQTAADDVQP
jgi:hypothetical protein